MRNSLTLCFLLSLLICKVYGQANLVPNHSFETYTACPDGTRPGAVFHPIPWTDSSSASCDYFNECGTGFYHIPTPAFGDEYAQDSAAFIGLATFLYPNQWVYDYREYAQVALLDTLRAGHSYCVSFYISLADSCMYSASNMSAYFSTGGAGANYLTYFNYNPQINNSSSNMLTNKIGWTLISGSFVASGGERFMTIGNFERDSTTDTLFVDNGISPPSTWNDWRMAYYYIDNVSVTELEVAFAGVDTTICLGDTIQLGTTTFPGVSYSWSPGGTLSDSTAANPSAFPESTTTYTLTQTQCYAVFTQTVTITVRNDCDTSTVFFIPTVIGANQSLIISGLADNSHLTIYDMRGRRVFYSENYQNDFRGDSVAEGQYVVELVTSDGEYIKQKLIVTR